MEAVTDTIMIEEKTSARAQMLMEGSVPLPEGGTVIATLARAVVTDCDLVGSEALVQGKTDFQVLIQGEQTDCLTLEVPWSHSLKVALPAHGQAVADVVLSDVRGTAAGGEVRVSALAEIEAEAWAQRSVDCLSGLEGEGIQLQTGLVETDLISGAGMGRTEVRQTLDQTRLREGSRVLLTNGTAQVHDAYCSDERVMLTGEVRVRVVYASADEAEPFGEWEESVEFAQAVDAPGVNPDCTAEAVAWVQDCSVTRTEEGLDCELVILSRVCGRETRRTMAVTDAYSTNAELDCRFSEVTMLPRTRTRVNAALKLPAPCGEGMPPIAQVLFCDAQPMLTEVTPQTDRLTADGVMETVILYRAAGAGLSAYRAELPFTCTLDVPGLAPESVCRVRPRVLQCSAVVTAADETELRLTMGFDTESGQEKTLRTVIEAEEGEKRVPAHAICVYTVGSEDTPWSAAKHLGVTQAQLMQYVPEDDWRPGQKIVCYYRLKAE